MTDDGTGIPFGRLTPEELVERYSDAFAQVIGEVGHEMGLLAIATGLVPDDTTIAEAMDAALTRIKAVPAKPRRPLRLRLELGPHGPAWLSLLAVCGWMAGVVVWDGVEPFEGVGL